MRCELWKTKALPFIEGTLAGKELRGYAAHLECCEVCRAEAAASRSTCRAIHDLPALELGATEAARFDAAVMARVRTELAAAPAVAATVGLDPAHGARQHAARSISVAARSRLARRRFEPLFAPIPSIIALSLALVAGAVGLAAFFGDTLLRGMGVSLDVAAQSVWLKTNWLAHEAVGRLIDLVTVADVTRGMFTQARPWLDAWNLLLITRSQEILIVTGVTTVLVAAAIWKVRRDRRRERATVRSS